MVKTKEGEEKKRIETKQGQRKGNGKRGIRFINKDKVMKRNIET